MTLGKNSVKMCFYLDNRTIRNERSPLNFPFSFVDTGLINCQEYPNDPKGTIVCIITSFTYTPAKEKQSVKEM